MNKHDNIYNILGKLAALEPQPAEPAKQESILKQLNESVEVKPLSLKDRLNARFSAIKEGKEVDEDMLAKKDYDNDGKRETGKQEYMGSRDKAIKKAMGKTDKSDKDEIVDEGVTTQDWMKDPQDPASKVPAYQRKANEPGRQAAQANVDALNQKSGASVWRNPRAVPPTMDEDGDNAYASLPEVRKTTDEEHSEYQAAAHELRKWMRKRGWDTKKEFKSALKYVMDNLDSKHDDTLTDKVKEAACTCDKHHKSLVGEQPMEEGFPTVADARARAEKKKALASLMCKKHQLAHVTLARAIRSATMATTKPSQAMHLRRKAAQPRTKVQSVQLLRHGSTKVVALQKVSTLRLTLKILLQNSKHCSLLKKTWASTTMPQQDLMHQQKKQAAVRKANVSPAHNFRK